MNTPRRRLGRRLQRLSGRDELRASQPAQRSLVLQYRQILEGGGRLPSLRESGFRVYSGVDEDGILLYIYAVIGASAACCVDIAFGLPQGANTTNLLCNWGWTGVLVDADTRLLEEARSFFATHPDTWIHPPRVVEAWVTAENVNEVLEASGASGEVDLLSLDLDGIDWWIWRSLEVVRPRVVVAEVQDIWGPERAVTVPYRADFQRPPAGPDHDHFGASLPAFVKLARDKGYRLVGTNRFGFNAFFVADGLGEEHLPEVTAEQCLRQPALEAHRAERLARVEHLEWVDV